MINHVFWLSVLCCVFTVQHTSAQVNPAGNRPAKNTARVPIPTGAGVVGVFDGRSPCQEIAKELQVKTTPACIKIKWRLILYQDSVTHAPTRYQLEGFVYRNPVRSGKWILTKGMATDANAVVVQLDPDDPQQSIYLLKADDYVLFFLDHTRRLMTGNEYFGYTLYRTEN